MGTIPSMSLEHVAEHKGKIENVATQINNCEKVAKALAEETTQFWICVVQDEQPQQPLEEISTQNGAFNPNSNTMSSCVS